MSRIKPLNDFILIERLGGEKITPGGIVLPDAHKTETVEGRVIAVGPGATEHIMKVTTTAHEISPDDMGAIGRTLMPVKVGDLVVICENSLHPVTHKGVEMYIAPVGAVFGVVEAD